MSNLTNNQHCSLTVTSDGTHKWRNSAGQLHRVDESGVQDGPACIYPDGYQAWYLDDVRMTQEEWAQDIRVIRCHSQTQESVGTPETVMTTPCPYHPCAEEYAP